MLKYGLQKTLSLLPFRLGWRCNALLQRNLGGLREKPIWGLPRALTMVALLQSLGHDVEGKTLVELGTGWDGAAAFTLLSLGAGRVHSFDLHRHLDAAMTEKALRLLAERTGFTERQPLPFAAAPERWMERCDPEKIRRENFLYCAPADVPRCVDEAPYHAWVFPDGAPRIAQAESPRRRPPRQMPLQLQDPCQRQRR